MQQLTQQLKTGQMEIVEVPVPRLQSGQLLVRNHYSVISAGTEGKTVSDARKGYLAKARSRQKEVKQVLDLVKAQGFKAAYDVVMNKLEALSPLGYSCAGEVIAIAPDVKGFKVGDKVACGGATASHADVVAVPKNLCTKVADQVSSKEAAFTTIASIALQGIRQSDLQVGGTCVVIGLGLIGIIAMKLLEASGIKAFGIDVDAGAVERARKKFGFSAALRSASGLVDEVQLGSGGYGADAVLITAGTSSLDPVNLAGQLCRQKGIVVVVGAVPTGFDRKDYYRKELDLRMSCSYGPGRYDARYEEQGIDYPVAYARWTEQRNMQTIADLLAADKLVFSDMISHTFPLEEASKAYGLILEKKESFLGILIRYPEETAEVDRIVFPHTTARPEEPRIGVLGAGSFAHNVMLPLLHQNGHLEAIATSQGTAAVFAARKYQLRMATTQMEALLDDEQLNTMVILTRHNHHAHQVMAALRARKHVMVEKPLCINEEELEEIRTYYESIPGTKPLLMVGFNRRFAPATRDSLLHINARLPRSIQIRVNAGTLPPEHWVHDPKAGGGRIVGEGCHFIDLAACLAGSEIVRVAASAMQTPGSTCDTVTVNLEFKNGSVAGIAYFSNGNKRVAKEEIEIFSGGTVLRIIDFKLLEINTERNTKTIKYKTADKGHRNEVSLFMQAIREGREAPITFDQIYQSMKATFAVETSIREKRSLALTQ